LFLSSEFVGNIGGQGGTLSIAYFPVMFKGNVTFVNSTGAAFRVNTYMYAIITQLKYVCNRQLDQESL